MSPTAIAWLRADLRRFDLVVAVLTVGLSSVLIEVSPLAFDTGWPEVPAGIGAFVLTLLRRRTPFVFLCIALGSAAVFIGIWERPTTLVFAGLVLLSTTCLRLDRWPAIGLGAAVGLSLYLMAFVGFLRDGPEIADSDAVIGIVWSALAVGVADAVRSWRRSKEAIEAQIRSAALAAEAQVRQQVSEERLSIARELHDLLAHNMSVMNVQTGAALHLLRSDVAQAETSLKTAREAGRSVLDELSELLSVLRDDGDAVPYASLPSVDEIPALVDTMRASGLDLTWTRSGTTKPLAPAVSLAAYRIVQEALTNAAKHGDGAADLTIGWDDRGVALHITNSIGEGTPIETHADATQRHGLVGMKERAVGNGGQFASKVESGSFEVEVWLPAALAPEATA